MTLTCIDIFSHTIVDDRSVIKVSNVTLTAKVFHFIPQLLPVFRCFEAVVFIDKNFCSFEFVGIFQN